MNNNKDSSPNKAQNLEIKEIPDINEYDDILNAAKTGRLVIFVGAGVSKLIGLPLWKEFAYNRLETIYRHGLVDYRTYNDLKNLEPKKLLTICKMFMDENSITPQPAKEVFKINDYKKYKEVYEKLYSMRAIYVTTNYDECLDNFALNLVEDSTCSVDSSRMTVPLKTPKGEVIINKSNLLESKLENGNVIHIHGSVNDESEMIVTLNDYMLHYGNLSKDNHPELSIFLDRIFNTKYVVLFIGYGLDEYEILEYMLSKVTSPKRTRTHYLLYSCFKEDMKLVSLLKKYYLGFGVELIPYDTSKKGYDQLITIIDEWSKVLNVFSSEQDHIQKIQFIDEVLADTSSKFDVNSKAVMEMANNDESLEKYLYKKISDIRWLDLLIENGSYNPERVPNPVDNGNGYYSIPYWIQTDFLNKLLVNPENISEGVIDKILNIIQEVSLYKDSEGNAIDNFHVWSQFTDIISKIPNEYITTEVLELTKLWTKSRFNIDFVIGKIGETLLDKFLNSDNPNDFEKAQVIIDIITSLNTDEKTLVLGDYYFREIFNSSTIELIAKKCSMAFIKNYLNKIIDTLYIETSRSTIHYGNEKYLLKLNDSGDKYTFSILQTDNDILTKILANQTIAEDRLLYINNIPYCNDDDFTKYVVDWMHEILDANKLDANSDVIIRRLYYELYTEGAYHSLYATQKLYNSEPYELLLHLYKDILLSKFQIEGIEQDNINFINDLLNSKYFALMKVGLYIIGSLPDKYLTVFWNNIDTEKMKLIFHQEYFGDELRVILENIQQIPNEYKPKILKLIEDGPYDKYHKLDSDSYKFFWKSARLNALRHIPYFNEYINKEIQEINHNAKLGPVIGDVETTWTSDKSPLTQDDLKKMTIDELSDFLSTYKSEDLWEGSTVRGLGTALRQHVKTNPRKYQHNLMPFINSAYYYIYEIFNGFLDAWKENKFIDWNNILDFMSKYIDRDGFWNKSFVIDDDGWNANYNWTIDVFADLICEGTINDERAIEYSLINKPKHIILLILDRIISFTEEDRDIDNDYIAYVLNSTKGRTLQALLYLSLYLKRNSSKEKEVETNWDAELQTMFTRYIDSDILDAYIMFGEYLPQFQFLDKRWTTETINSITYDSKNWEGFMVGYLYSRRIYKDIYVLMKNHYKYSIHHDFKREEIFEYVAHHIALGYLSGFEDEINNELFDTVVAKWDYKMISKILWYFWTYDDKLSSKENDSEETQNTNIEEIKQKIIKFWNKLYMKYKDTTNELTSDDKKIISDSIKLTGFLNDIDRDSMELIKYAIPYAEVNHNVYYFIKKICEFCSDADSAEKRLIIGEILLALVKYNIPTYPEEEIKNLVRYLYGIEDDEVKECADSICNIYAKHNIEFLMDICLENRDF